jgi:hypothetical protein
MRQAAVDDEQPVGWDDRHNSRRRHPTDAPAARPYLEQRRVIRIEIRQHALDLAATATCEREPDAVGEPVTGDRAGRSEPPALAQCDRHPDPVPPHPAMRNSSS